MGMPEHSPSKQANEPYQYQAPVQLAHSAVKARDPFHLAIDWAISLFGSSTVLLAIVLGGILLWRNLLKKFLH